LAGLDCGQTGLADIEVARPAEVGGTRIAANVASREELPAAVAHSHQRVRMDRNQFFLHITARRRLSPTTAIQTKLLCFLSTVFPVSSTSPSAVMVAVAVVSASVGAMMNCGIRALLSFLQGHEDGDRSLLWRVYLDQGVRMKLCRFADRAQVEVLPNRALVARSDDWRHTALVTTDVVVSYMRGLRRGGRGGWGGGGGGCILRYRCYCNYLESEHFLFFGSHHSKRFPNFLVACA